MTEKVGLKVTESVTVIEKAMVTEKVIQKIGSEVEDLKRKQSNDRMHSAVYSAAIEIEV